MGSRYFIMSRSRSLSVVVSVDVFVYVLASVSVPVSVAVSISASVSVLVSVSVTDSPFCSDRLFYELFDPNKCLRSYVGSIFLLGKPFAQYIM